MEINSFPRVENSIPAWNVDLPPHDVFVAPVSVVGKNSHLVENPKDIQSFIEEELTKASITVVKTKKEAKAQLDCRITVEPADKSNVPTELLQSQTVYSSIVVEVQLTQKPAIRHRQPYYNDSGICVQPNENAIPVIENCLKDLLKKLTEKK